MITELSFTIPGPPVPAMRPRKGLGGRIYIPDEARTYQNYVATVARVAAHNQRWNRPGKTTPLVLRVDVFRPKRTGDLSNYVKIVEDGINDAETVWLDDRYVLAINAQMFVSVSSPRVEVTLGFWSGVDEERPRNR